jgi:hypothetical protein
MMFENRVLRRIFRPKRDEVTGEWRKLQSDELYNLYSSPNIIRQIKSRKMRWVGHVARTGEQCTRLWWEGLKERDHLEDQGIHGRMGSERLAGSRGVEWFQLAQDRDWVASPCVCSDEPLGSGARVSFQLQGLCTVKR